MSMDSYDAMEHMTKDAIMQAHETLPKVDDAREGDYGIIYSVSGPGIFLFFRVAFAYSQWSSPRRWQEPPCTNL